MRRVLLLAGCLAILSPALARAQDLPGTGDGASQMSFDLPGIPMAPGAGAQHAGGDGGAAVLFSPMISMQGGAMAQPEVGASSSVDASATGASAGAQGGAAGSQGRYTSTWNASGFGVHAMGRAGSAGSQGNLRTAYSQRSSLPGGVAGRPLAYETPSAPMGGFLLGSMPEFPGDPLARVFADPATTTSDVPDLSASPDAIARGFAAGIGPIYTGAQGSSVQGLSFSLDQYGVRKRAPTLLSRSTRGSPRRLSTLHDRRTIHSYSSGITAHRPRPTLSR